MLLGFFENLSKLKSFLIQVCVEDLNIVLCKVILQLLLFNLLLVIYMYIYEMDGFSLGVFLFKSGMFILLYDYLGMYGMFKVLYGIVCISCMDKLDVGGG